jgi:hypothetical protein
MQHLIAHSHIGNGCKQQDSSIVSWSCSIIICERYINKQ